MRTDHGNPETGATTKRDAARGSSIALLRPHAATGGPERGQGPGNSTAIVGLRLTRLLFIQTSNFPYCRHQILPTRSTRDTTPLNQLECDLVVTKKSLHRVQTLFWLSL